MALQVPGGSSGRAASASRAMTLQLPGGSSGRAASASRGALQVPGGTRSGRDDSFSGTAATARAQSALSRAASVGPGGHGFSHARANSDHRGQRLSPQAQLQRKLSVVGSEGEPEEEQGVLFRIREAQDGHNRIFPSYARALEQIRSGRKTGHWIWYIWPCLAALRPGTSQPRFLLPDVEAARAYLRDETLATRLDEITAAAVDQLRHGVLPKVLFGSGSDADKFVETMTFFAVAAAENQDATRVHHYIEALRATKRNPDARTLDVCVGFPGLEQYKGITSIKQLIAATSASCTANAANLSIISTSCCGTESSASPERPGTVQSVLSDSPNSTEQEGPTCSTDASLRWSWPVQRNPCINIVSPQIEDTASSETCLSPSISETFPSPPRQATDSGTSQARHLTGVSKTDSFMPLETTTKKPSRHHPLISPIGINAVGAASTKHLPNEANTAKSKQVLSASRAVGEIFCGHSRAVNMVKKDEPQTGRMERRRSSMPSTTSAAEAAAEATAAHAAAEKAKRNVAASMRSLRQSPPRTNQVSGRSPQASPMTRSPRQTAPHMSARSPQASPCPRSPRQPFTARSPQPSASPPPSKQFARIDSPEAPNSAQRAQRRLAHGCAEKSRRNSAMGATGLGLAHHAASVMSLRCPADGFS
eukprot:TRINITY_DN6575_c0_g1_i2.p1 TRINITY_DN6575_c0_g1~~TRINITY_DN6575_c0_g1_i2.p1  ORF type:complete len:667 (-),score=95.22 TRINITY_DN6575_c0_g1_i2:141-2093(-)